MVTLLVGVSSAKVADASTTGSHTPAASCAEQATGPVDDAFKLAFCTDLVYDLAGIGQRLGLAIITPMANTLTTPVKAIFSPTSGGSNTLLMTKPFIPGPDLNTHGLVPDEPCEITVFPAAYHGEQPQGSGLSPRLHVLVAHEAVHCYQNVVVDEYKPGAATGHALPKWVSEASATYLATLYAGYGEDGTTSYWRDGWLGVPNENVTFRERDAVGWYSLVHRVTGDDLWSKMVGAWRAYLKSGANAYIAALGGDAPAIATAWAPSLLNTPAWGGAWSTPGIGVPSGVQPTKLIGLTSGTGSDRVTIDALAAIVDDESVVNDGIIEISVTDGYASVHDAAGRSYLGFTDEVFCLKTSCDDASVSCSGATAPLLKLHTLAAPFVVAAGGGMNTATYEIARIATPASPKTPVSIPKSAGPCGQGPGALLPRAAFSEGEPHLQTLNGGTYDFQGAGEYTLVRSASGDVDVQVRAAPFEDSRSVAFNTAVAMRVVSTDVEVDTGNPAVVLVNGKPIPPQRAGARALVGGGKLTHTSSGGLDDIVVTWPDGSEIDISASVLGEDVTFVPPTAGVDNFSGLLAALVLSHGTKKTKSATSETFVGGNGHRYLIDPTTPAGFKALYGPFAASWRVTPKTSLFNYPKGKSTNSFDVKGFPAKLVTPSRLPAQQKKRAAVTCKSAGVTNPKLLDDCEVDVVETGNADFATATARMQAGGTSAPKPPTVAVTTHPASYYFTHPCAAVSAAEVREAVGPTDSLSVSGGSACTFRPTHAEAVDAVTFSRQSVALFKSLTPGKTGSGPITSLGHDGYCIVTPPPFVTSQSYVIASLGPAGSIQVLAGNCTEATALTKDALSRISGL